MPGISLNYNQSKSNVSDSAFSNNQNSSAKRFGIYAGINFGYFIKDNFAVGITGGYQRNNYDYSSSNSNTYNSSNNKLHQINNIYNLGLFARYYKMINSSKFGIFIQANAQYTRGYGKSNQTYSNINVGNSLPYTSNSEASNKTNSYDFGLTPGIIYFITNKIGIETSFGTIGYLSENVKYYNKYNQIRKSNSEGFNINLSSSSIKLGVNYYIRKSK
jgi:outer membrane protein W